MNLGAESRMVFFVHMMLFDHDTETSMCIGETGIVTEHGYERVTHAPRMPIEVH
jgi:hypothetical protein